MNTKQDDLAETLRQIASGSRRSKIVRLREIFDLVEEAKAKGASNKEIVAGLAEHGLIFDVPNFKNARSRILKERALEALTRAAPAIVKRQATLPAATRPARATVKSAVVKSDEEKKEVGNLEGKNLSLDARRQTRKFEFKPN